MIDCLFESIHPDDQAIGGGGRGREGKGVGVGGGEGGGSSGGEKSKKVCNQDEDVAIVVV